MKFFFVALVALSAIAQTALVNRITAASLRGRLSFLSSDLLEGRNTPSRGLDLAAEYIASEFRRAKLESPTGDYFQNAGGTTAGRLRNVAGILRGSDSALSGEYILISAHYDHIGLAASGQKDTVFNGANDDGSGVVTVIELAHAFAHESPRPKRSIVFLCFFGEEKGLLGSTYYVNHPLVPLARTIAAINFEQMGEPERGEGHPPGTLGITGPGYSDLAARLAGAVQPAGVTMKGTRQDDDYFNRSDNFPFAQAGVVAHTLVAAFDFPDYHRASDEWPKLDYENMATLDRGIALGILDLANRPDSPRWNEANRRTKKFALAWHAMHP